MKSMKCKTTSWFEKKLKYKAYAWKRMTIIYGVHHIIFCLLLDGRFNQNLIPVGVLIAKLRYISLMFLKVPINLSKSLFNKLEEKHGIRQALIIQQYIK